MGQIFNIRDFNRYIGTYSRCMRRRTVEKRIGWYIPDILYARIPTLALRNLNEDPKKEWPLIWKQDKILAQAILLTLDTLKAWQAFRPLPSDLVIKKLTKKLPSIILRFQREMLDLNIYRISDLRNSKKEITLRVIQLLSNTVGEISEIKNNKNPMMGSKIMHFLFPELFPIWDTYWIKNKALVKEDYALPEDLEEELSVIYDAAYEYASYVNLMIRDLKQTTVEELNNLKKAFVRRCIKHGEMSDASVVDEFFWDINPILFEICLLGKHC